jgi:hypothetical protein
MMRWWRQVLRCLGAYEVHFCPWCWGEVLVRDGLTIHLGDVCQGWRRKARGCPLADETAEKE